MLTLQFFGFSEAASLLVIYWLAGCVVCVILSLVVSSPWKGLLRGIAGFCALAAICVGPAKTVKDDLGVDSAPPVVVQRWSQSA